MNGLAAAKRPPSLCRSHPFMDKQISGQSAANVNGTTGSGHVELVLGLLIFGCDVPIFLEPVQSNDGDVD